MMKQHAFNPQDNPSLLTETVSPRLSAGEITIMGICLFIGAVSIKVTIDFIPENWASAAAGLVMDILLLLPVYRILRKKADSRQAVRMEERLRAVKNAEMDFSRFTALMENPKAVAVLEKLLRKKYLRGILIDYEAGKIVLLNLRERAQKETAAARILRCRNCGGENQVLPGRICRCEFCGSELLLQED